GAGFSRQFSCRAAGAGRAGGVAAFARPAAAGGCVVVVLPRALGYGGALFLGGTAVVRAVSGAGGGPVSGADGMGGVFAALCQPRPAGRGCRAGARVCVAAAALAIAGCALSVPVRVVV